MKFLIIFLTLFSLPAFGQTKKSNVVTKKNVTVKKKKVRTVKFIPPVIKEDEEVPPPQEEILMPVMSVQNVGNSPNEINNTKEIGLPDVFRFVEQEAQYIGGDDSLQKYLSKNIIYPKEANEKNIEGTVIIEFIVSDTGKLYAHKVSHSVHPLLDAEALRVVKNILKYLPAKQNGKAVSSYNNIPITFALK